MTAVLHAKERRFTTSAARSRWVVMLAGLLPGLWAGLWAEASWAEDPTAHIELNAMTPQPEACRLVLTAQAPAELQSLVVETVLFDQAGQVALMTLFDFGTLPAAKLRVRQFDIPGTRCSDLSRILFNGIDSCEGPEAGSTCTAGLTVASKVQTIEVLG